MEDQMPTRTDALPPRLDLYDQVASGRVSGYGSNRKFGARPVTPTGYAAPIWTGTDVANRYPGFITVAEPVIVRAADAADDIDGAGARTAWVFGLDSDWNEASGVVELNGAGGGDSATVKDSSGAAINFIRVNRIKVGEVGTYGVANTGVLQAIGDTSGAELAHVVAGVGQTEMCIFTIPGNRIGLLRGGFINYSSTKALDMVELVVRENAEDAATTAYATRTVQAIADVAGGATVSFDLDGSPEVIPSRADVWVRAQANSVVGAAEANMFIRLIPA
jgi:hypothetical protein